MFYGSDRPTVFRKPHGSPVPIWQAGIAEDGRPVGIPGLHHYQVALIMIEAAPAFKMPPDGHGPAVVVAWRYSDAGRSVAHPESPAVIRAG